MKKLISKIMGDSAQVGVANNDSSCFGVENVLLNIECYCCCNILNVRSASPTTAIISINLYFPIKL